MYNTKAEAKSMMRRCGFLPKEINEFMGAHVLNKPDTPQNVMKIFNSKPFAEMLKRRADYCMKEKAKKHDRLYIMSALNKIYKQYKKDGNKITPWDFLKSEYKPPKMLDDASWNAAMAVVAKARINVEKVYGKPEEKPKKEPRFKPVTRKLPEK